MKKQRISDDNYETPKWAIRRFLEKFPQIKQVPYILEPSAGNGKIIEVIKEFNPNAIIYANELREECRPSLESLTSQVTIQDYLLSPPAKHFPLIIGNPPFSLAMEFIEHSLKKGSVVAFLLRVNFLASNKRVKFMQEHTPSIYVLPNRPSFVHGKTDMTEYAWFVWEPLENVKLLPTVHILDATSKEERKLG
jgi:hypothetical protein